MTVLLTLLLALPIQAVALDSQTRDFQTRYMNADCARIPTPTEIHQMAATLCPTAARMMHNEELNKEIRKTAVQGLVHCRLPISIAFERKGYLCRAEADRRLAEVRADQENSNSAERIQNLLRAGVENQRLADAMRQAASVLPSQIKGDLIDALNQEAKALRENAANYTQELQESLHLMAQEARNAAEFAGTMAKILESQGGSLEERAAERIAVASNECGDQEECALAHILFRLQYATLRGSALYPPESTLVDRDPTLNSIPFVSEVAQNNMLLRIARNEFCGQSTAPLQESSLSIIRDYLAFTRERPNALELAQQRFAEAIALVQREDEGSGTMFRLQLSDGNDVWVSAMHVMVSSEPNARFRLYPNEFFAPSSVNPRAAVEESFGFGQLYGESRPGRIWEADLVSMPSIVAPGWRHGNAPRAFRLRDLVAEPIEVGETIFISGYPGETFASPNHGRLTTRACRALGYRAVELGSLALECDGAFHFIGGMSGGPAFDSRGRVVGGITSATSGNQRLPGQNHDSVRITPIYENCLYVLNPEPLGPGAGCFVTGSPPLPPSQVIGIHPRVRVPCSREGFDVQSRYYPMDATCSYSVASDGSRRFGFLPELLIAEE